MPGVVVSSGDVSESVKMNRPRFSDLWQAYAEIWFKDASAVYDLVGGSAAALRAQRPEYYANACALRISRAFNYGGYKIPSGASLVYFQLKICGRLSKPCL
ncbi:hypothetical protein D3C75_575510 [compost metagenome]|jgi:hypothetical protein